jgi:predicted CoA-substrate-specific enzyme activase
MSNEYYCGVDVGASTTKVVLINGEAEILGSALERSGMDFEQASRSCLDRALAGAKLRESDVTRTVSTGYGRQNVPFSDMHKTEIACHARGCHQYFPRDITVVDIGGQDNKIIHVASTGARRSFKMNRKCAAGTGAFLEEIASRLSLPVVELDGLARKSTKEVTLGSFCTVFTQTEILAKIRKGAKVADIVKGAFRSVIKRIMEMDPLEGEVVLTGGVVQHNPVIVDMFAEQLDGKVLVPPEPQLAGAFGAALYAKEDSR